MMAHVLTRSLDRSATVFLIVVAAVGVLIPLSNLLLPAGSIFQVPTYLVALFGKYVCYAILVLIILFIQKRPRGLFALKGRAVEA